MTIPFFSIIMPVYNKQPHIKRAITSVLNQTYDNFELIIIDDASTDGSLMEVNNHIDERICVYTRSTPGPGGYAARNLGISLARSKWLAFIDADDEWHPLHLEKMIEAILANQEVGFFSCGWVGKNGNMKTVQPYYKKFSTTGFHLICLEDYLNNIISGLRYCNTSVIVVNKDIMNQFNGFPEGRTSKGGDLFTWIKMFQYSNGGWVPYIGATTHRDSVNMVTKSNFFNPDYIAEEVKELMKSLTTRESYLLKKYANGLLLKEYLHIVFSLQRTGYSLKSYIFYLNNPRDIVYKFFSTIPVPILLLFYKFRKFIKLVR